MENLTTLFESYLEVYQELDEDILDESSFHGKQYGQGIRTRSTPSGSYSSGRNEPDQRKTMMSAAHQEMKARWKAEDAKKKQDKENAKKEEERKKKRNPYHVRSGGIAHDENELRKRSILGRQRRSHQRTPSYIANMKGRELNKDKSNPKNKERFKRIRQALKNKDNWGTKKEELEYLLNYLISEGFAVDFNSAISILDSMGEEWGEAILEKWYKDGDPKYKVNKHGDKVGGGKDRRTSLEPELSNSSPFLPSFTRRRLRVNDKKVDPYYEGSKRKRESNRKAAGGKSYSEEYDIFDIIQEYLLDEGYAETLEAAQVIMVNMSEDWRELILVEKKNLERPESKSKDWKDSVGASPEEAKRFERWRSAHRKRNLKWKQDHGDKEDVGESNNPKQQIQNLRNRMRNEKNKKQKRELKSQLDKMTQPKNGRHYQWDY